MAHPTPSAGKTRVLVTGADESGFVGPHLMRCLEERNFTALPSDVWLPDRDGFARLAETFRPHAVIHLAAISHLPEAEKDPLKAYSVNVDGTRSVLDGLRQADPEGRIRMVYISTGHLYRSAGGEAIGENFPVDPRSIYDRTKLAAELVCHIWCSLEPRRPLVIFRPFNHTGPGQRPIFASPNFARQAALIEAGRQEPVLHTGNLSSRRDFCSVKDVVRAYAMAAGGEVPPGTYNLASGRSTSLREIAGHFLKRCRVSFEIRQKVDLVRCDEIQEIRGSAERIFRAAGWRAEIPLEKTLDDLLDHWRERVASGEEAHEGGPESGKERDR